MASIISEFESSPEWKEITEKAYPPPVSNKKVKKPKDKGSRHPGHAAAKTAEIVVPVVEGSQPAQNPAS